MVGGTHAAAPESTPYIATDAVALVRLDLDGVNAETGEIVPEPDEDVPGILVSEDNVYPRAQLVVRPCPEGIARDLNVPEGYIVRETEDGPPITERPIKIKAPCSQTVIYYISIPAGDEADQPYNAPQPSSSDTPPPQSFFHPPSNFAGAAYCVSSDALPPPTEKATLSGVVGGQEVANAPDSTARQKHIKIGNSAGRDLSAGDFGNVWVPSKYGGRLELAAQSGCTVKLYYIDGTSLTDAAAKKIELGDLQPVAVGQGAVAYDVPVNKFGRYFIRVSGQTVVSAKFSQHGRAAKQPWTCPWFPMSAEQAPNLYAADGALKKYDAAFGKHAWDRENREFCYEIDADGKLLVSPLHSGHRCLQNEYRIKIVNSDGTYRGRGENNENVSGNGHCDKMTAVIICEDEPLSASVVNGQTFTVEDKKALLVALYDKSSATAAVVTVKDYPAIWQLWLEQQIMVGKKMVGSDIDPTNKVWNYPIIAYNAEFSEIAMGESSMSVTVSNEVCYWSGGREEKLYYKYILSYNCKTGIPNQGARTWETHEKGAGNPLDADGKPAKSPDTIFVPQSIIDPDQMNQNYWNNELEYDKVRQVVPAPK